MKQTIQEYPITERPRERMEKFGVASLSNSELLAILLRSGGPDLNALQLSQTLLAEFGGLQNLFYADTEELKRFKYLGLAKVSCLKAVGELVKRSLMSEEITKPRLDTPRSVYDLMLPFIMGKDKETLYLLSLDLNNHLIKLSLLSIGTLTQTLADTREVLKTALLKGAVSIVLVHNHPSDNLEPSFEDKLFTKEIALACPCVGLNFLDHIIVTERNYYSFKLSGLLNFSKKGGE